MLSRGSTEFNRSVSAVVAAAIVGMSGLAIDRAHYRSPQSGIADVKVLQPADVLPGIAMLPEVVVTAPRFASY